MRWFENHRQEWIAETLHIFGFINREYLIKKFGVSIPQASVDLNSFQRKRPGLMAYNLTSKRYEITEAGRASLHDDKQKEGE